MVVVTPKANKPTLNFDTMLFVDKGKRALGRVFDVFGPVTEPHYCVRFNNAQHIKESDIKVGMTVYYCPNTPYTTLVFMTDLLKYVFFILFIIIMTITCIHSDASFSLHNNNFFLFVE